MNRKSVIIFTSILLLAGCQGNTSSFRGQVTEEKTTETTFHCHYGFGIEEGDVPLASLLFDSCYFAIEGWTPKEEDFVAGDELTLIHSGTIRMEETYPGKVILSDGTIKETRQTKTEVFSVPIQDRENIKANLPLGYTLSNDYVVFQDRSFVEIEKYEGDLLYYSIDRKRKEEKKETCPIAQVYGYDPRG